MLPESKTSSFCIQRNNVDLPLPEGPARKLKHELTREKQNLDKRAKKLNQKVNESEVERESLLEEKKSLEKKLETAKNRTFEIDNELDKTRKE